MPNDIEPRVGMFMQAYMWRRGLGGGMRLFMVLKIGRKSIELFYPPRLLSIRISYPEWHDLKEASPVVCPFGSKKIFRDTLQARANAYAHRGMRFNQDVVRRAIEQCGGKYATPKELIRK